MKKRTSFKVRKEEATKHMTVSNPRPKLQIDPHAADLIAFAGVEFICFEYDPTITVNLVRRGEGKGEITLTWKTENGNVSAESYQLQEGAITFAEGQMEASLDLVINDNPAWSTESTMCARQRARGGGHPRAAHLRRSPPLRPTALFLARPHPGLSLARARSPRARAGTCRWRT